MTHEPWDLTMTLNQYQGEALKTAQVPAECTPNGLPVYYAMGLAGEAGEYLDKVKKAWRNQKPLDRDAALRELGDVLWYIATNAHALGATLEEVASMNIAKLADRHARGVIKSEGDDR